LTAALAPDSQQNRTRALSIPLTFRSQLRRNASGFFSAGHHGSIDNDTGCYTTAFRFLVKHSTNIPPQKASSASAYQWEKLGFVTFHPSPKCFTIFCFDIRNDAQVHIRQQVLENDLAALKTHPLLIHCILLRYVLESFDRAVWSWRDVVRELETSRLHRGSGPVRDFQRMHEIARHLIHSTEMLTTALCTIECMMKECDSARSGAGDQAAFACLRELESTCSLMKALLHRSSALEKRMENEIALVSTPVTAASGGWRVNV
jgi:hypothetical protein